MSTDRTASFLANFVRANSTLFATPSSACSSKALKAHAIIGDAYLTFMVCNHTFLEFSDLTATAEDLNALRSAATSNDTLASFFDAMSFNKLLCSKTQCFSTTQKATLIEGLFGVLFACGIKPEAFKGGDSLRACNLRNSMWNLYRELILNEAQACLAAVQGVSLIFGEDNDDFVVQETGFPFATAITASLKESRNRANIS